MLGRKAGARRDIMAKPRLGTGYRERSGASHKYEDPSLSDGRGSQLETTGERISVHFIVRVQP